MPRQSKEDGIQRAVVAHLRARGVPGLLWTHPPNGGYRSIVEAAKFKAMGTRAGVSDLLLWHNGKSYSLELKAPGGRISAHQANWLEDFARAGFVGAVAVGLDAAINQLEQWGLLK